MHAAKLVITIKNLTYKDRLKRLKLPTHKYRRIRGDMIEVYKILTNDSRVKLYLEQQQYLFRQRAGRLNQKGKSPSKLAIII